MNQITIKVQEPTICYNEKHWEEMMLNGDCGTCKKKWEHDCGREQGQACKVCVEAFEIISSHKTYGK